MKKRLLVLLSIACLTVLILVFLIKEVGLEGLRLFFASIYQIEIPIEDLPPSQQLAPLRPPEGGFRVLINNDAKYTNTPIVTLSLFGGPDAAKMAISNFSDFRDATLEIYTSTKTWNLCQGKEKSCEEGEYTVYAKFYAPWDRSSETVSDSIIYQKIEKEMLKRIPANFRFERNLRFTTRSIEVKYLQIILNSDPETKVAQTGPGSPGRETTFFGPLTKEAVIRFQEKYQREILAPWGLTKGTGFVGATTRAKLNEILGR